MPRRRTYRKKPRKYRKKKSNHAKKTFQVSGLDKNAYRIQTVNSPMMPRTRLCKLKYVTRFQIDPHAVKAGATETANNMAVHTLVLNSLYDIDYTATNATGMSRSGAPNHQPRMYDQWGLFYEYMTVVGAKVNITFTTKDKTVMTNKLKQDGTGDGAIPVYKNPEPCFIGYLNHHYEQTGAPTVRLDDALEKNELRYKKTLNRPGSYKMKKYWSLKKDPLYKTELHQSTSDGSDVGWGAEYAHNVDTNNRRYLHIVANPVTVEDDEDPLPIDVLIQMEQIVLMSDLRDIAQSN